MQKLAVEVLQDPGRPEGGYALIRLSGLSHVPDALTYRIKPVETAHDAPTAWPGGERRPISTRVTGSTVEMVVGPELVESPLFLPGTLALIEIPQCGARGELLWPRIAPLARPRRRHVVAARGARPPVEAVSEPSAQARSANEGAVEAPAPVTGGAAPAAHVAPAEAGAAPRPAAPAVDPAATAGPGVGPSAGAADAEPTPPAIAFAPATRTSPPASLKSGIDWIGVPIRRAWYRNPRRVAAIVVSVAVLGLASSSIMLKALGRPDAPAVAGTATGSMSSRAGNPFADLVAIGTTSPRGTPTRDTSPVELLERADSLINGDESAGDRQEAGWMLRRYLARTLADERTLWALTQLGSLHAEPGNGRSPDYVQARQVWEVAANLGDPVAMCFLAALFENGLGMREDRVAALEWYRRARHAGGCTGVDDAIARTSRK